MNILITGLTGFIGRHLVPLLQGLGHEIFGLSRDDLPVSGVVMKQADLGEVESYEEFIKELSPDVTIHLAWEGIPDYSQDMSKRSLINSINLLNILCEKTDCRKIIASGSCYEYGKQFGTCKESDSININSNIAWAKYSLYSYADYVCRNHGIELIWFRIFYAYGLGQRRESLIPMLFEMLRKREIPAIKNPLNANDFVYNEDIAEAFNAAVNRSVPSGIYNLGSGSPTKVIDICEIVESRVTGNNELSNIIRNKINCEPEINFWADTNKTSDILGWKSTTSLEEGIAKYELSEGK
jgi:nucleoside-diphosphate-sugar epimerase